MIKFFLLFILILPACSKIDRLSEFGEPPSLSRAAPPQQQPGYQEINPTLPKQAPLADEFQQKLERMANNSLWHQSSSSFFRDQQVRKIGDIVKVILNISNDSADLKDDFERSRGENSEDLSVNDLMGLEKPLQKLYPHGTSLAPLLEATSSSEAKGSGSIKRKEQINIKLATMVTQVLPNGKLFIKGSQEVRVNNELRQLSVEGMIRTKDINANGEIDGKRIAEARISYGGKGIISDVQKPRWGQELVDIIAPF
ncbi:MAG: flagellar basal body L-ring protein FlgH [Pseudomonadota bacterium]